MKKATLLILLVCISFPVLGQDIASHQWMNRVLIVMAESKDSELLQQQIDIFNQNEVGITERKLLILLMTPLEFAFYSPKKIDWQPFSTTYDNYKLRDSEIELVLIGLDGQIKHRKYSVTPALEIFVIIDTMPMRQSELRNSNNQH